AERELVKRRKHAISERRRAERAQKRETRNERLRVKRAAMTPEQIEAQRKKWRDWQRARYAAMPETRKEEIRQRLSKCYYANRDARLLKQREYDRINAEILNRKSRERRAAARERPILTASQRLEAIQKQAIRNWRAFRRKLAEQPRTPTRD